MKKAMLALVVTAQWLAVVQAGSVRAGVVVGWGSMAVNSGELSGKNFVAVAAGAIHSLALKSNGSIVGWGRDDYGQATPMAFYDFVAIAAGWQYSLGLRSDGSLVGWGANWYGQATPPEGNDFVAIAAGAGHSLAIKSVLPPLEVSLKITPKVLNPGSKGNWVKAHVVLPEGYGVEDVDVNEPAHLEPLGIESEYMNVFVNEEGLVEIEIGFGRSDLCAAVTDGEALEVTVVGMLVSGREFAGTDTIRIIARDMEYLGVLASYWLEAGCGGPDWCGGADLDQDSRVDLIDFALFDGCCIEVIS